MTERWGTCPRCKGQGKIRVVIQVEGDVITEGGAVEDGEATHIEEQECGRCNGEGYDGSPESR